MTPQVSQAHLDANFWRRITAGIAALNHQNIWIGSEVLATEVTVGGAPAGEGTTLARQRVELDGLHADLALTKDE